MANKKETTIIKQDPQAIANMDTNVPMGFED